jgi:hypothetical protein
MPEMGKKCYTVLAEESLIEMTYNFDPDKWYDNELFLIQAKLKISEITQNEYDEAIEILDKKHEEMWKRLDGTYQIGPDN